MAPHDLNHLGKAGCPEGIVLMSINKVILIGRLGKDPEVRILTSGESVANVTLATSENWKDKSGKTQEKTEWHNLVFTAVSRRLQGSISVKGR